MQEGYISPNSPNPNKAQGCFVDGVADHQVKNCPKKGTDRGSSNRGINSGKLTIEGPTSSNQPIARTFNITVQDAVASKDVVSSTIPINNINTYILFDLDATCSFISKEFAQRLNLPREKV